MIGSPPPAEPLALYVHWPFCLAKCPYCDFNSHVRPSIDQPRFAAALLAELRWEGARLGRRPLASIFFGGGTPSLMAPATVAALIDTACSVFSPLDDLEITLEANPTSVEAARLAQYAAAGVNRVSLGIQSLDPAALRWLGREHDVSQARAALHVARARFARVSFDLIYARPGQSLPAWEDELRAALDFGCDHFSLYQLTIEPGTAFEARHRSGDITLPDDDHAVALYDRTAELAAEAGLRRYEISNFARPGAQSRHNLAYWRYGDYAGIGPGAHGRLTVGPDAHGRLTVGPGSHGRLTVGPGSHGRLTVGPGSHDRLTVGPIRIATRRHRAPEPWATLVERHGHGSGPEETLDAATSAAEALLMGLRLEEGIEEARFARRTGLTLDQATNPAILAQAIEEGYLIRGHGRLRALAPGLHRLDALLAQLVR